MTITTLEVLMQIADNLGRIATVLERPPVQPEPDNSQQIRRCGMCSQELPDDAHCEPCRQQWVRSHRIKATPPEARPEIGLGYRCSVCRAPTSTSELCRLCTEQF